jgi:hypothetical protein
MLTTVTITGADDATNAADLAAISREFPFVEWGILYSTSRAGERRYPSQQWRFSAIEKLDAALAKRSAHFCGQCSRDVMAGDPHWIGHARLWGYNRLQLNGFRATPELNALIAEQPKAGPQIILQVGSQAMLNDATEIASKKETIVSALWDVSGGRGVEPANWPSPPESMRLGYAGGITPDNVLDVVMNGIGGVSHDFWIDMESGVRTDDRLDLGKVLSVLEKTAMLVSRMTAQ